MVGATTGLIPEHLCEPSPWLFSCKDVGPIAQVYAAHAMLMPGQSCVAKSEEASLLQERRLGLFWVHFS